MRDNIFREHKYKSEDRANRYYGRQGSHGFLQGFLRQSETSEPVDNSLGTVAKQGECLKQDTKLHFYMMVLNSIVTPLGIYNLKQRYFIHI